MRIIDISLTSSRTARPEAEMRSSTNFVLTASMIYRAIRIRYVLVLVNVEGWRDEAWTLGDLSRVARATSY